MDFNQRTPHERHGFIFEQSSSEEPKDSPSDISHSSENVAAPLTANVERSVHLVSGLTSPYTSRNSSAILMARERESYKYFRSRRIKKEEIQQPWKDVKDPREKWVTIIPIIGILLGLACAGYLIYDGLKSVVKHKYTLVFEDDFSNGFNEKIWMKESNVGGFGNGEFEQTTTSDENVFIKDGRLHIKPTLQDEHLITTNNNLTLTDCTGTSFLECNAVTNTTNGTIVPPVKSGRITTRPGASLKYGRIEVTATLPIGDWLWPAIWLLPKHSKYGPWPASGEIDMVESRGNNYTYAQGGNNIVSSALHWGPTPSTDAWWQTNTKRKALHTTFAAKEHTFGMEWSEKYLFTYIDNRLLQIIYTPFVAEPLWTRGRFPLSSGNGTTLQNPWQQQGGGGGGGGNAAAGDGGGIGGNKNTPFDQEFYLILNVAVGGTNGWFEDGKSGKPWVDKSVTAKKDFWDARDQWLPTWKKPEMVVSKVKMWQQVG